MQGRDKAGLIALIVLIAVIPLVIGNEYYLGVLIFTAFNCLTCIGLCLLMGYAGQISIGHGAFVAIGAYSAGILTTALGWSPRPANPPVGALDPHPSPQSDRGTGSAASGMADRHHERAAFL